MNSPTSASMRSHAGWVGLVALLLLSCAPLYRLAYQTQKSRRFEIGTLDRAFFADEREVYAPSRMKGPIRYPDGSVEVIDFYARLTRREVTFQLPYRARRSPLRLFIRSHRFGMQGTVSLTVNGEPVDTFVFGETSYPWGGISAVLPEDVAARGALSIRLVTRGGMAPPSHIPEDFGLGIDYIDVEPMSEGVELRPLPREWGSLYLFLLMGLGFTLLTRLSPRLLTTAIGLAAGLCVTMTALFPVITSTALSHLWVVFPVAATLFWGLRIVGANGWVPGFEATEAAFVAGLFAIAVIAHSVLIVFPNHFPPDVPLHAMQASWLHDVDMGYESLMAYSRQLSRDIAADETLMAGVRDTSEMTKDGSYGAPYPPFFYLLTYSLSRLSGDLRFTLEFLSVLLPGLMLVLVYLTAKNIWRDVTVARMAALLFAVEIGVWHHATRGHGPGIFGAFFVLLFLWSLAAFARRSHTRLGFLGMAVITMVCLLSYTVALIQIGILMGCFLLATLVSSQDRKADWFWPLVGGFALGVAGAMAVYYGPFVAGAIRERSVLVGQAEAFDPPATFLFLRNQLRDTVRLLQNGHVLYVLASLAALIFLTRSGASAMHRRLLMSAVATYVLLMILKDPAFIPRVFLHAKEDLFYSSIACLLLAWPLARLWTRPGPWARPMTLVVFAGLLALSVYDKSWNANTLNSQPMWFQSGLFRDQDGTVISQG